MSDEVEKKLSRRKAMTRLGGAAFAAYTIPAFTMLSAAHAASSVSSSSTPSAGSTASVTSAPSDGSGPSDTSGPSDVSGPSSISSPSGPSGPARIMTTEECEAAGGEVVINEDDGTKRCMGLS